METWKKLVNQQTNTDWKSYYLTSHSQYLSDCLSLHWSGWSIFGLFERRTNAWIDGFIDGFIDWLID